MLDNLDNAFVRRIISLTLATVTCKVFIPRDEWDAKPTDDEVLNMADSFDSWIRTGRK